MSVTLPGKKWRLLPHAEEATNSLAQKANISPVIAQLLWNRGVRLPQDVHRFLHPVLTGLRDPAELPGNLEAAQIILNAVKEQKSICIYGDYDADGLTGTAILVRFLKLLGANPRFFVPNRLDDGYGLNSGALESLAKSGVQLVVTVDCGIASIAEAKVAENLGLDLIITDHHSFKETLPKARAIVHPRLPGSSYPFGDLSGSAVALKLAWMMAVLRSGNARVEQHFRDFLVEAISLASLGIVADVVPLLDENRILVRSGLERLSRSAFPGLQAMIRESELSDKKMLSSTDIGFKLAPRINAVGRIGCAQLVVDLLTTNKADTAEKTAEFLSEQNKHRQRMEKQILSEAREIAAQPDFLSMPFLLLAKENWHPGIIGIVAGRILEEFQKPTIILAPVASGKQDGSGEQGPVIWSGSGRSGNLLDLNGLLQGCDDLLIRHGGHRAAAGLQIQPDFIPQFRQRLCDLVTKQFPTGFDYPPLQMDAEIPLPALNVRLVRDLNRLEPYGAENKRPIYLASDLLIPREPTLVGEDGQHLRFQVSQGGVNFWAIAFRMGKRKDELMSQGGKCSVVFTPNINSWNGADSVQLEIQDFQAGSSPLLV